MNFSICTIKTQYWLNVLSQILLSIVLLAITHVELFTICHLRKRHTKFLAIQLATCWYVHAAWICWSMVAWGLKAKTRKHFIQFHQLSLKILSCHTQSRIPDMLSPHLKPNLILTFANVRPKGYLLPYIMKPKKRVVLNFNWLVKREGRSQAFQFPRTNSPFRTQKARWCPVTVTLKLSWNVSLG